MRRQDEADTGPEHVHRDEADHQRDGRDDLEVDDRPQPHASDGLDVARARNPRHEGPEDQRRNDHLDQPQEELAERVEVLRPLGMRPADEPAGSDPEDQSNDDLLREGHAGPPDRGPLCWGHRAILPDAMAATLTGAAPPREDQRSVRASSG